jgi:hypothetical protein
MVSERLDVTQTEALSKASEGMAKQDQQLSTEAVLTSVFPDREPEFLLLARLGPEVIYLEKKV